MPGCAALLSSIARTPASGFGVDSIVDDGKKELVLAHFPCSILKVSVAEEYSLSKQLESGTSVRLPIEHLGPCLEAARTRQVVRVRIADAAQRWPEFTANVAGMGVASYLSAPLTTAEQHVVGALNPL